MATKKFAAFLAFLDFFLFFKEFQTDLLNPFISAFAIVVCRMMRRHLFDPKGMTTQSYSDGNVCVFGGIGAAS